MARDYGVLSVCSSKILPNSARRLLVSSGGWTSCRSRKSATTRNSTEFRTANSDQGSNDVPENVTNQ